MVRTCIRESTLGRLANEWTLCDRIQCVKWISVQLLQLRQACLCEELTMLPIAIACNCASSFHVCLLANIMSKNVSYVSTAWTYYSINSWIFISLVVDVEWPHCAVFSSLICQGVYFFWHFFQKFRHRGFRTSDKDGKLGWSRDISPSQGFLQSVIENLHQH